MNAFELGLVTGLLFGLVIFISNALDKGERL